MTEFAFISSENPDEWDSFVQASPQGTLFCTNRYLKLLGAPYEAWVIKKGAQIKAGLVYTMDSPRGRPSLHDLFIHGGLLFPSSEPVRRQSKYLSEQFALTEQAVQFLTQRFEKMELALSPGFEDLRPFLWHNYHSSSPADKFRLDLRYTSYLALDELAQTKPEEDYAVFQSMSTLRQRNIREARKVGAKVNESHDIAVLLEDYEALMTSQGETVSSHKLRSMRAIMEGLIESKQGKLYSLQGVDGRPVYSVFYGIDSKRAYYLFGAGKPEETQRFRGTVTFWDSMLSLARMGIRELDFEGINSPKRGAFKLSFGGVVVPYYELGLGDLTDHG